MDTDREIGRELAGEEGSKRSTNFPPTFEASVGKLLSAPE